MDPAHQQDVEAVVRILKKCRSILFVTGAGISADSGLPTYRGIGGLYDVGETEEGFPIEDILSGAMFRTNPELTWKYLGQIAHAAGQASFNRAHAVITSMEQHFPRVWTLTQNVDGFHTLAGSRNVIEIHGNMRSLSCTRCAFHNFVDEASQFEIPPCCPNCAAILRPDVVLFGEMLPEESLGTLRREMETGFGAVFSIGTSGAFPYIQEPFLSRAGRGFPQSKSIRSKPFSSHYADYRLPIGAAAALDEIWTRFTQSD